MLRKYAQNGLDRHFKLGIKFFLVFSIHVFHTQMGFTDNHMNVNVFLKNV